MKFANSNAVNESVSAFVAARIVVALWLVTATLPCDSQASIVERETLASLAGHGAIVVNQVSEFEGDASVVAAHSRNDLPAQPDLPNERIDLLQFGAVAGGMTSTAGAANGGLGGPTAFTTPSVSISLSVNSQRFADHIHISLPDPPRSRLFHPPRGA